MHALTVSVLSSGSCGNSILVRSDGESILIDAGISCRELEKRMSYFGAEPTQVAGVVLTHEHTDHVRGVRGFCSKHGVPVYGTRGTLALTPLGDSEAHEFAQNKSFKIGSMQINPFKVRHLAAEPVAVSVVVGSARVGIASDLGSVTPAVVEGLRSSDLLMIESNYDDRMLTEGDYPEFLKKTIRGDHGHLSNDDAGRLAARSWTDRTEHIVLLHLSKDNNRPDIARAAVEGSLLQNGIRNKVEVAEHGVQCGPFSLR